MDNKKINIVKLMEYGFVQNGQRFLYQTEIADGQLLLKVSIDENGEMSAHTFDVATDDEYILHLVETSEGAFVGKVRSEYSNILSAILAGCFDMNIYKSDNINGIMKSIEDKYGDKPEFPWHDENAVVRRKDNGRWYAVFLKIPAGRIGLNSDRVIEIMNIKLLPETIQQLTDNKRYFPAYHMNKKHWITVLPEEFADIKEIEQNIEESYNLTGRKK